MTDYSGTDIYCDLIIPHRTDGKTTIHIIKETEAILAYYHTKPFWPTHIVVTPKVHVNSLLELDGTLADELLAVVKEIAEMVKTEKGAARVTTNLGEYQDNKHLHIHVNSGDPLR